MHRILAVDDERDILDSLARLLPHLLQDVEVDVAEGSQEGIDALDGRQYDVVISDYKMPGMDGLEFLSRVHDRHPDAHLILMTAYPDARLAAQARADAQVEAFLRKPFNVDELGRVLQAMLT